MKKTEIVMKAQKGLNLEPEEMDGESVLLQIAYELIQYRAKENLTQKELAEQLGMTYAMICRLESGEYNPTILLIFDIAKRLGWNFKLEFGGILK